MLNTINLQGRITDDPEIKQTTNGVSVVSFTLAVDRNYQSGSDKKTDFINCVAWRGTADFICRNFNRGKMMVVNGSLQTRSYIASDGSKRYVTEVVVSEVFFAGDKGKANTNDYNGFEEQELTEIDDMDDLPF